MIFDIGRLCVKIAGRDAGKRCVIVDVLDDHYVLIDGETRRRKCNVAHLEPLKKVVEINKGATSPEVSAVLESEGIVVVEKKSKQTPARPKKQHVQKNSKKSKAKK
jgi:large subunit ribosomal protein L14e